LAIAFIEQCPEHTYAISLLGDRAENDLHQKMREFAREKLRELSH
jgi:hypothetical protein